MAYYYILKANFKMVKNSGLCISYVSVIIFPFDWAHKKPMVQRRRGQIPGLDATVSRNTAPKHTHL